MLPLSAMAQPFEVLQGAEPVFIKSTLSAFVGTGLDGQLRADGTERRSWDFCVEPTIRSEGYLGHDKYHFGDAIWAYGEAEPGGSELAADQMQSVLMAIVNGDLGLVVLTDEVIPMI